MQGFAIQMLTRVVLHRHDGSQWKHSVACTQLPLLCGHCASRTLLLHAVQFNIKHRPPAQAKKHTHQIQPRPRPSSGASPPWEEFFFNLWVIQMYLNLKACIGDLVSSQNTLFELWVLCFSRFTWWHFHLRLGSSFISVHRYVGREHDPLLSNSMPH